MLDGVLNPDGTPIVTFVVPAATGWNVEMPVACPPVNTTGEVTVPAAVLLLVTGTFTVTPPRTGCSTERLRSLGLSSAAATVIPESVPTVEVKFVVVTTNPDGFTVTLIVALL